MPKIALLGMVGLHKRFPDLGVRAKGVQNVTTPFGKSSPIHVFRHDRTEFAVINRFGEEEFQTPPAHVPDRANIWALKVLGVEKVVALASPGSLRDEIKPGHCVIPHDLLDENKVANASFFEAKRHGFIRSFPLFCPEVRRAIGEGIGTSGVTYHGKGLYVCTPGPRLETASQVRVYRHHGGDLVGQALVPETFLARELELCYGVLCWASYWAEGVVSRDPEPDRLCGGLVSEEEEKEVAQLQRTIPELFLLMLEHLPVVRHTRNLCFARPREPMLASFSSMSRHTSSG